MPVVPPLKDTAEGYEEPVDVTADGLAAAGFYVQVSSTIDSAVGLERDGSGNLILKDANAGSVTLSSLGGGGGGGNDVWKQPCRIVTTADDTLSGLAARDGVTPIAGDRVLVARQDDPAENGIYVAAAGAWARATDADSSGDVLAGTTVQVNEGSAYADTQWTLITNDPITLGTTGLAWRKLGFPEPEVGPTNYTAAYDPNESAGVVVTGADVDELLDLQSAFDLLDIGATQPQLVLGSELRNVLEFNGGLNGASFENTSPVGLATSTAYTLVAEFRIDTNPALDESNTSPDDGNSIIHIGGSIAAAVMQVRYNTAGYPEAGGGGFGPSYTDGRSWAPVSLGQWYLAAVTWDGTTLRVKIDDNAPVVTTPSLLGIGNPFATFRIGRGGSASATFDGQLGRIRIYGYALSPPQLASLYNELRGVGTALPANVDNSAANPGVSDTAARSDHKHDIAVAAPTVGIGGGNAVGSSTALALADHNHALRTTTGPTDLTIAAVADGQIVRRAGSTLAGVTLRKHVTLAVGSAVAVTTGEKTGTLVRVPFAGTIVGWSLVADVSSTVTLDVWKAAGAVPTNADSITASAKPSLTAASVASSSTLTGWTTAVAIGDVFMLEVEANDNAGQLTLVLDIEAA